MPQLMPLEEGKLQELVDQLDAAVPQEGAMAAQYQIDDDGCTDIWGNRQGLFRLGIEILKFAAKGSNGGDRVMREFCRLGYLGGLAHWHRFVCSDHHPVNVGIKPAEKLTSLDWAAVGGLVGSIIVLLLFCFASLVVGAITIVNWLF